MSTPPIDRVPPPSAAWGVLRQALTAPQTSLAPERPVSYCRPRRLLRGHVFHEGHGAGEAERAAVDGEGAALSDVNERVFLPRQKAIVRSEYAPFVACTRPARALRRPAVAPWR